MEGLSPPRADSRASEDTTAQVSVTAMNEQSVTSLDPIVSQDSLNVLSAGAVAGSVPLASDVHLVNGTSDLTRQSQFPR